MIKQTKRPQKSILGYLAAEIYEDMMSTLRELKHAFTYNFIKHAPVISLLVALNVGVYIMGIMSANPVAFIEAYAHHPQHLEESWRLLTYMFLHCDANHLRANMSVLLAMVNVEACLGSAKFLTSYLAAGLMAALIPQVLGLLTTGYVLGASGAISGMVAISYLLPGSNLAVKAENENHHWAKVFKCVIASTILDLGLVYLGAPIAWMAHMFGAMTGIAIYSGFKRLDAWLLATYVDDLSNSLLLATYVVDLSNSFTEKAAAFQPPMSVKSTVILGNFSQTEMDHASDDCPTIFSCSSHQAK